MLRVDDSKNLPFAEGESSTPELLRSLSGMFMDKGGEFYIIYSSEWYIQVSTLTLETGKPQRNGGKVAKLYYDLKL